MKKLAILAITATLAIASNGVERLNAKTSTEEELKAAFNHLMTLDEKRRDETAKEYNFWVVSLQERFRNARLEMDTQWAASGKAAPAAYIVSWPKSSAIAREKLGWSTNFPVRVAVANRLGIDARYASMVSHKNISYEDCMELLNEGIKIHRTQLKVGEIATLVNGVKNASAKTIKRRLREQGMSFVTKDGVNPVAERMQGLVVALNAPRFAGLNEWNQSMGVASRVDVSSLPSEQEILELKNKLLYGELDMGERNKVILRLCLGVDGYNQFVKEYNGDK